MKYDANQSIEGAIRTLFLVRALQRLVMEGMSHEPDADAIDRSLRRLSKAADDMQGEPIYFRFKTTDGTTIRATFLVEKL